MATTIYPQGNAEFTVPDAEKVTVFSNDSVTVKYQVGYPNFPSVWKELTTTAPGDTYLSAAFSGATLVRIEARAAPAYYAVGAAPSVSAPVPDITAADATFDIAGLDAAQGGYVQMKGGGSSTAGNAGGAALLTGGAAGATGVGGAATVKAGAGGATSGNGGIASLTGGAGTNSNATGGVGKTVGGAGQGTGTGGAGQLTGGASGAGATGKGGAAQVTGGASAATDGSGGSVILSGGAKSGSGIDGGVINRGTFQMKKQPAPQTATNSATLTAAQILGGILAGTPTGAAAYTVPTGTDLKAALPTDLAADDSFDVSIINLGATTDAITVTANTDITVVGDMVVGAKADVATVELSSGIFRFRFVSGTTFVCYRIS